MARLIKKHSKAKGLQPGHVVFIGQKKEEKPRFRIIDYTRTDLAEVEANSIEECFPFKNTESITWINIDGLHDVSVIEKIGAHFGIHPLIMEDIANTGQRPKLEIGDSAVFLSIKMLYLETESNALVSEQFSCIFGANYVISFQERVGDVFESVRERLRKNAPREKFLTTDYLAYALVDAVADHYFVVLEDIAARIESLEEVLIETPKPDNLAIIHELKRQLILMRKATWPLREVVSGMERADSVRILPGTKPYIRDLYEHTIQVIDTVETFRDMVSGLLDIYLSSISNKMNEVMKVLTIIATIFIPLGFLAGVYGMNFDTAASTYNMPELGMPYGYILFWVLSLTISFGLLLFFRKKNWI
ncbi:MAG: magnesium/cobalt transporter CorA [Desulfopila sp.]|jgi:magnesium transporter|nr:magnesium/cobalt transporter CorA [Desulfopila sp.]